MTSDCKGGGKESEKIQNIIEKGIYLFYFSSPLEHVAEATVYGILRARCGVACIYPDDQ